MSSNEIAFSHIVITVSTQFSLATIPSSMKKKTFSGLELMPKRTIFGNHGIVTCNYDG